MSVILVIAVPLVAGTWPFVSAAVVAASAALGYHMVQELESRPPGGVAESAKPTRAAVSLVMEESQIMADSLARGEAFTVEREGLHATFSRDGRGRCIVHVSGEGRSSVELEAAGRELMDRVRQQFAYARVMEELETRGFDVVQEQVEAEGSIRIRVKRWS